MEDSFPTDWDQGWEEVISGRFKHITFIVHLTSIIITSAPPQIIRSGRLGTPAKRRLFLTCLFTASPVT